MTPRPSTADRPVGALSDRPVGRRALLRRGALAVAGAGTASLALAGCAGDERTEAGIAVVLPGRSSAVDGLETLPTDLDHAIELPGLRCRVESAALLDSLPRTVAAGLGLTAPSDDEAETWLPADGEAYLVAVVVAEIPRTMDPQWPEGAEYTDRAVIGGEEVASVLGPLLPASADLTPDRRAKTVVASVPADLAAADAVLELADGEVVQSISLLDGTRIASTIEGWYAQVATASPEHIAWERYDDRFDGGPVLAGCVVDAVIRPSRIDGTWPADGRLMLGVGLSLLEPMPGGEETSTLTLVLPDGSEAEAETDPSAAFASAGATRAWFEVPGDLETATVRLALSLDVDGEALDQGTEEIALTITREDR